MYGVIFGKELSDILLSFLYNFLLFFSGAWRRHPIVIKKNKARVDLHQGMLFHHRSVTLPFKKMCYMNNNDNKNVA